MGGPESEQPPLEGRLFLYKCLLRLMKAPGIDARLKIILKKVYPHGVRGVKDGL